MSDSFYLYFMSRVVSVHIVILVVLVLSISKKFRCCSALYWAKVWMKIKITG